jgi:parvulin-like peptidyl-prolyl isomerase
MTARSRRAGVGFKSGVGVTAGLLAGVVLALTAVAGGKDKDIVARIGPTEVDRATFEAELARAPHDSTKTELAQRREFMDAYVNRQLIVLAARDAGYFDSTATRNFLMNGFEESLLCPRIRDEEVRSKIHLTPADVDSFHARTKLMYDVSQILVPTPEEAEAVKARLAAGEDFAALATELSMDEKTIAKGGRLDPFVWGATNRSFLEVLDSMAPGEIRGPIVTEVGYHVVRLNGRPANESWKPLDQTTRPFFTQRAQFFVELDSTTAYYARLQARHHFTPDWPLVYLVRKKYVDAIAGAVAENPNVPRDQQCEIAKRRLVFPESLQAQTLVTWDFGRYPVLEQWQLIRDLPGLAVADRRNPHFIVQDAAIAFHRSAEAYEARQRGYDKDPDFQKKVALKREELAVSEYYQGEIMGKATFTEADERAYYEKNKERFTYSARVKLACVQYQADAEAAAALEAALGSPAGNPDSVIAEHDKRGLIRTRIPEGKWFSEVQFPILYERAAGLKPGDTGRVVDEEGYWTVFVLLEKEPEEVLPFEEARKTIQQSLANVRGDEVLNNKLAELKKRYKVWVDEAYLVAEGSD